MEMAIAVIIWVGPWYRNLTRDQMHMSKISLITIRNNNSNNNSKQPIRKEQL